MSCSHWINFRNESEEQKAEFELFGDTKAFNSHERFNAIQAKDSEEIQWISNGEKSFREFVTNLSDPTPMCLDCYFKGADHNGVSPRRIGKVVEYLLNRKGQYVIRLVLKHFASNYSKIRYIYDMKSVFVDENPMGIYASLHAEQNSNGIFEELQVLITKICGGRVPNNVKHLLFFLAEEKWQRYSEFVLNHPCLWTSLKTSRICTSLANLDDKCTFGNQLLKGELQVIANKCLKLQDDDDSWESYMLYELEHKSIPEYVLHSHVTTLTRHDEKRLELKEERKLVNLNYPYVEQSVGVFRFIRNLCIHETLSVDDVDEKMGVVNYLFPTFICEVAAELYNSHCVVFRGFCRD